MVVEKLEGHTYRKAETDRDLAMEQGETKTLDCLMLHRVIGAVKKDETRSTLFLAFHACHEAKSVASCPPKCHSLKNKGFLIRHPYQ